jgi:predicted O-linked N-acetylglucosamine transferase (SPINDLY family)
LKAAWLPHANDRSPDRRLRIGYVSADLRDHVVGKTFLPCFEAHDRSRFELFCYSESKALDSHGERFRRGSDVWRETANFSHAQLAAQIREDRIDILVDISLHTACNRLLTFARKPAPVQITWLGYPGRTGLEAMDYWVADPCLAPPDEADTGEFERPLRLPDCWCCYGLPADSPDPGSLPMLESGVVTFGSYNNFSKINDRVLGLWAEILRSLPGSRLLLLSKGADTGRTTRFFERNGVEPQRVEFLQYYPSVVPVDGVPLPPRYLERYRRIDIALDPFPKKACFLPNEAISGSRVH